MRKHRNSILMLVVFVAFLLLLMVPRSERTVASFCDSLIEIEKELENKNGNTYRYGFLENGSNDVSDIVDAMKQLENSAPDEIQNDVETLRKIAERIEEDPTQAAAAGLSGITQEDNVQRYINENCEI